MGIFVWDLLRLTLFGDQSMKDNMIPSILVLIIYVICAALLFLSMR